MSTKLQNFINTLGGSLLEMTSIEVNTMVVDEITTERFLPWDTYRQIFILNHEFVNQESFHPSLRNRYLAIRDKLAFEYSLLPFHKWHEGDNTVMAKEMFKYGKLPNPFNSAAINEINAIDRAFQVHSFLQSVRRLASIKHALDRRNYLLLSQAEKTGNRGESSFHSIPRSQSITNTLYAQTSLQLDGYITNRYSEEVVNHPQCKSLLKLHQTSVVLGQKQWNTMLGFVTDLLQNFLYAQ
ncbi:MAG: hypothetical protein HC796_06830 [Synechococcaceae cyanobacterium RL_1_2]|nr:hypothetical protein [Synechococcaceae cyanobacterium RL_1_2]